MVAKIINSNFVVYNREFNTPQTVIFPLISCNRFGIWFVYWVDSKIFQIWIEDSETTSSEVQGFLNSDEKVHFHETHTIWKKI